MYLRYFSSPSLRPALGPTHLPFQRVPGSLPGVKLPVREVNQSPSPNTEAKKEWSYTSTLSVYRHGVDREKVISITFVHNLSVAQSV